MPTRRDTLFALGAAAFAFPSCSWSENGGAASVASADRNLYQSPPLNRGRNNGGYTVFDLKLQAGKTGFFNDRVTPTIGINQAYLGQTLEMSRGATVRMNVTNTLNEDATLHWHGFHVPARFDGTPHQRIAPGETWNAQFEVRQRSSMFWYHSHAHRRAGPQVYHGLAGAIIVRDPASEVEQLPHVYGEDDLPLIVQDRAFASDGRLIYASSMRDIMMGMTGDTLLVNGVIDPVFECSSDLLRLRLLNGSNARIYQFGFLDQRRFQMIASDGGLLENAVTMSALTLAPGERAEILVDASHGAPMQLIANPILGGMGMMQGGMMGRNMMGEGGRQRRDRGRNRSTAFNVLLIVPNDKRRAAPKATSALTILEKPDASVSVRTRRFVLGMEMGMRMRGGFTINGKSMDMRRIDERVKIDTTEIWEVENASMMPHPFHIHDVQFRVIDRNGRPPQPYERGLKDTVLLVPRERVRLLLKFSDYADSDMPYMYHCHILEHEDAGMMGQFVVEA